MSRAQFGSFVEKLHKEIAIGRQGRKGKGDILSRGQIQDARETLFSIETKFIREAVMTQLPLLNNKYDDLDPNDIVISVELMLRDSIDKFLKPPKTTKWFNSKKDIVVGKNFRAIQDLMTNVRKDLRQNARNTIEKNKRKLLQEEANITSIVVTGIDVRDTKSGGDLVKEDLKNGVIVASGNKLRKIANTAESGVLKGSEIGHTFGPGLGDVAAIARTELINLFSPDFKAKLIKEADEVIDLDSSHEEDVRLFNLSGRKQGTLTVTVFESTQKNNATSQFKSKYFLDAIEDNLDKLSVEEWVEAGGSPSILDKYEKGLEEKFLTNKIKRSTATSKRKSKVNTKHKIKVKTYGPKLSSAKKQRGRTSNSTKVSKDLGTLRGQIHTLNRKLHDKIKENMGKGGSKRTLNYRTGRFAKSAKIQDFFAIKEKGAVGAQVRYRKHPYAVFEPGGRLHLPGRDPHKIFGRSIRQLLQEEKIATLRRVKVVLRG